jgi:hypothetical protein
MRWDQGCGSLTSKQVDLARRQAQQLTGLLHVHYPTQQLVQHEGPLLFLGSQADLLPFHWVMESAHG